MYGLGFGTCQVGGLGFGFWIGASGQGLELR